MKNTLPEEPRDTVAVGARRGQKNEKAQPEEPGDTVNLDAETKKGAKRAKSEISPDFPRFLPS